VPRGGGEHPVACHFAEVMNPLNLAEQAATQKAAYLAARAAEQAVHEAEPQAAG
jgi:hypothetical protein